MDNTGGWTLHIQDPSEIESGTLRLSVPSDVEVSNVTGGTMLEYNRIDTTLYVAFVREPSTQTEMFHVEFTTLQIEAPLSVEGFVSGNVVLQISAMPQPMEFTLTQNVPNPFNPTTTIGFTLREASYVQLGVYDVNGRLVQTLVSEMRGTGDHQVLWNGRDNAGRNVASGVYMYRLQSGRDVQVRRMTLLR